MEMHKKVKYLIVKTLNFNNNKKRQVFIFQCASPSYAKAPTVYGQRRMSRRGWFLCLFFPQPLERVSLDEYCFPSWCIRLFMMDHKFSIGFRSALLGGHTIRFLHLTLLLPIQALVYLKEYCIVFVHLPMTLVPKNSSAPQSPLY